MDYGNRIAKVEADMEHQKEMTALLREDIARLDQKLDQKNELLLEKIDRVQHEILVLTRWTAGLVVTVTLTLLGLVLKAAGAF